MSPGGITGNLPDKEILVSGQAESPPPARGYILEIACPCLVWRRNRKVLCRRMFPATGVLMRDAQVTHSTRFVMPQAPDGERAEDIWAGATSLSRTFQRLPGKVRGGVLQYLALHLQPGIFMP